MLRVRVAEPLREQWTSVIARHFQMTLAAAMADLRSLTVSFRTEPAAGTESDGYVCELRGQHHDGRQVRIRSVHNDGATAIGNAFARARREIRRRRTDGSQRGQPFTPASNGTFAAKQGADYTPTHGPHSSANSR